MAAPCGNLVRSAFQGLHQLSYRTLWTGSLFKKTIARLISMEKVLQNRALHCRHHPLQTITKTVSQKTASPEKPIDSECKTAQQNTEENEDDDDNRPEYIPKRKAKNPMMKIGYAWMIGLPAGIIGFILAKRQVDKNRLKQLKIRQRMKKANEGDYDSERYKPAASMQ